MDCKRCGAPLNQGAVLCPECGTRQRRRAGAVHCARCFKAVPLGLTVCPHCGRDVRPAGPRWEWWAVGLIALVLVSLWGLGKLPIEQAARELQTVRERVSGLVQVLGPANAPSAAPSAGPVSATATPAQVQALARVTATPAAAMPLPSSTPLSQAAPGETTEAAELVTPSPAAAATAAVAAATVTPEPTAAPTGTPTATPLPSPTATLRPPTATPTAARSTASGATTYRVQSGDTLSSIATRFGITWEALAAANGLTSRSTLRVGQELTVPLPGAAVPPAATPAPRATATPAPPSPTPQPQLAAPILLDPADQSNASPLMELTWQPVIGMGLDGQYQVVVRWVEQGAPQEHYWFTTSTGTAVPTWLAGRADQPTRKYTWFVRVVTVTTDGQGGERVIPLSPDSQSRVFYWN